MNLRKGFFSSFRTGAVFRCLLTLVALFYVAQHASVVAHLALVQHAVCDEHGELVDVEVATTPAAAATTAPRSSERGWQESPSPAGHHDHCGVLAHLRQQLSAPVFAGIPVRVAAVPEVASVSRPIAPSLAIPVYWLAPKNSPPA